MAATAVAVVTAQGWVASAQPAPALSDAAAIESPRFALSIAACGARDAEVRAILAIEAGELLLDGVASPVRPHDRLSIACAGAVAQLEATAAGVPAPVRRSFDLAAFPPDAVARALALAGLETLAEVSPSVRQRLQARASAPRPPARSAAGNGTVISAPAPPPAGPAPAPSTSAPRSTTAELAPTPSLAEPPRTTQRPGVPSSTERSASPVTAAEALAPPLGSQPSPLEVGLSGTWRAFGADHGARWWGGRLSVDRGVGRRWNAELDLDAGFGRQATALGTVAARALSLGAFWGLRAGAPTVTGVVGVGGRVGLVNLAGTAEDDTRVAGDSVVRPWAGPAVLARMMAGRGRWLFTVAAEAGVVVRGAKGVAGDDTAVTVGGPWLMLGAGVAFRLKP